MTDTILANARLVLSDEVVTGSITLRDGLIAAIDTGARLARGALDCDGDLVMPGLIELHTDNLERHIEPRPRVQWPHKAAIIAHDSELASVGITTVFDALRIGSLPSSAKLNYGEYARVLADEIDDLRTLGALRISHLLHLRAEICSETLIAELAKFGARDRIGIVSLMDHTPGARQFRDLSQMRAFVCGRNGLTPDEFEDHVAHRMTLKSRNGIAHESAAVAAARTLGAVLASHDDTEPDHVARSAAHGVTFAEFPTTFAAAQACRIHGILVMMGGPNLIRGASHSGNVAARVLAAADLLDIVSSDYVPSSLLTGALMLADLWGDLPRGVATVTATPAHAAGLRDRGRLELGLRADVIRVVPMGSAAAVRGVWIEGIRVA